MDPLEARNARFNFGKLILSCLLLLLEMTPFRTNMKHVQGEIHSINKGHN